MRYIYILLTIVLLIFKTTVTDAQTVLDSSGSSDRYSTGAISWSVGEPVIQTFRNESNIVTSGVIQGEIWNSDKGNTPIAPSPGKIIVAPVPTDRILRVDIQDETLFPCTYNIYDILGRKIFTGEISASQSKIDLKNYPPAVYIIHLVQDGIVIFNEQILKTKYAN